jgi:hypothetical protein
MSDEGCRFPSKYARGRFPRLNHHHLVHQHRLEGWSLTEQDRGFKSCSLVVCQEACTVRDSMGAQKIMTTMTRWTPPQVDPYPPSSPLSKLASLITFVTERPSEKEKKGVG